MAKFGKRKDNPEARMSIGGHLRELRNRAIIAGVAILIGSIVGWMYYQDIYEFLKEPITEIAKAHPGADIDVNYNGVTAPFSIKLKVAMWAGFVLATPIWLWQIWAYLAPGLTKKEKRIGGSFIVASVILFSAGVYFGTRTFGNGVRILLGATPENASNLPTASEYFSFVTRFILAFGLSFMLPVLLMAINVLGVLSGRAMFKGWRLAIVLITLFAAIMTPTPDAYSMFLMAAPLLVLFFGTAAFAVVMDKFRGRREAKNRPEWMDVDDSVASPL